QAGLVILGGAQRDKIEAALAHRRLEVVVDHHHWMVAARFELRGQPDGGEDIARGADGGEKDFHGRLAGGAAGYQGASRCTISGPKAGRHTARYSAPPSPGVL